MDWTCLDALADQLDEAFKRGALRGLPPVIVPGTTAAMDAEVLARIVLADCDHVRQWERAHLADVTRGDRLQDLAAEIQHVLSHLRLPC